MDDLTGARVLLLEDEFLIATKEHARPLHVATHDLCRPLQQIRLKAFLSQALDRSGQQALACADIRCGKGRAHFRSSGMQPGFMMFRNDRKCKGNGVQRMTSSRSRHAQELVH